MNKHLTKKHGRPPPVMFAVDPRARKIILTASRLTREHEKLPCRLCG